MRLKPSSDGGYSYRCPCGDIHHVTSAWRFNGDHEKPTFSPSVLVQSGHYADTHKPGDSCWCTYAAEHPNDPAPFKCYICHVLVRDGAVQFLSDCTHPLAGQTVPLSDFSA